ncbi:MAG TPA: helix-turn-helix domain-containing protein, partial [Pseudonocardiaceae bacterium]|nr:helix-turn-helix domain-containing protein [Pseudonocardiaceae bacterium]
LAAGVDVRRPLRVLAAAAPGAPVGRAVAVLTELVAVLRSPGLVGVVDEEVYALLPTDGGVDLAAAVPALRLVEPALTSGRFVVGISSVTTGDLRGAVHEARYALELGERQSGRTRVVAGDEVAVHRLLLAGVPDELRVALRRRVLGPVFDHDAEHGGDLVRTLTVFLDCSGSWSRAAARLHVHVNTLRYRIGRIEELTGADLSDFAQRIDIYLALHSDE